MPFVFIVLFGLLSACFALLIEIGVLSLGDITNPTFTPFNFSSLHTLLLLAVIEEVSKFLFLAQFAKRFFSETHAMLHLALLLGILFGIGFSAPEFFLSIHSLVTDFTPIISVVALHILTSILLAYYVFFTHKKQPLFLLAFLALAISLHVLYNLLSPSLL